MVLRLSWLFCLLLAPIGAEPTLPTARADIQAAYAKAALGARLKFIHGMLCHRSADFELFGPDGRKLDLTLERERFRRLFEPATRVELTTKIVLFESKGNRADCRVEQVMSIEAPEPQSKRPTVTVVTTYLVDSWIRHGNLWRLRASQVVLQGTRQQEGRLDRK